MDIKSVFKKIQNKTYTKKKGSTKDGRLYLRLDERYVHLSYDLSQIVEKKNKKSLIIEVGKGKRRISHRKDNEKVSALIDLKTKDIKEAFSDCDITFKIYDDIIVIEGVKKDKVVKEMFISTEDELLMASGGEHYLTGGIERHIEIVSNLVISKNATFYHHTKQKMLKGLRVASIFAGMGGLDYAFKQKGFDFVFALDKSFTPKESALRDYHIETYRKNVGDHIVASDILTYPIEKIPPAEIFLAGIPCQELSSVSPNRNQFKFLPDFVDRFIRAVKSMKDTCQVFVVENSNNLLTAGRQFVDQIKKELNWFTITENNVDAADYGSYQHRKRAILIGSTIGPIELKAPSCKPVKTVGMALNGLTGDIPNQMDYSSPGADAINRMRFVPPGGNGKDIPEELRTGKFANSYKRLHPDTLACTIANVRKSMIMPPYADRVLSIRECLRLCDFPDDFICYGSLSAKQQMVANTVPLALGKAIANAIANKYSKNGGLLV